MRRNSPPVIYLDTADYSVFSTVLAGGGTPKNESLFRKLEVMQRDGKAIFAYSLPILSELLQFAPEYYDKTIFRAQAIEQLCGRNAFLWPARSIALELALLIGADTAGLTAISKTSEWYPNVEHNLNDIKGQLEKGVLEHLEAVGSLNRAKKREATARLKKTNLAPLIIEASKALVGEYGLAPRDVELSIGAVLENKISSREGAKRLFGAIARPTTFIDQYFIRHDGDRDLPRWVNEFSRQVQQHMVKLRNNLVLNHSDPAFMNWLKKSLEGSCQELADTLVSVSIDACGEFSINSDLAFSALAKQRSEGKLNSIEIFRAVLQRFLVLNSGAEGAGNIPEKSAGGDLLHTLYLLHSDFWRTDRRFADLVKRAVPLLSHRVVSKLEDLPEKIEMWWKSK